MEWDQRPSPVAACVIRVSWRPQLATFNSSYPIQQKGETFAIPGEQSPEEGQAICGLSGTTLPNRKISPLPSGAYSFSARSPMGELASRKRVGSNRIIHRSAVSDPGKLS
jgi:hypothetical protein